CRRSLRWQPCGIVQRNEGHTPTGGIESEVGQRSRPEPCVTADPRMGARVCPSVLGSTSQVPSFLSVKRAVTAKLTRGEPLMRRRVIGKGEAERPDSALNRRSFLKMTAGASAAALLSTDLEAALPEAKITSIRVYEAPTVLPLRIPLLQSSMVVVADTDVGVTGIGEGGTRDALAPTAARLIGRNPFEI